MSRPETSSSLPEHISGLKARIARLAGPAAAVPTDSVFATGHHDLDRCFGGGLAHGCVHELFPADAGDIGSATGLGIALAWRARRDRRILWLRSDDSIRRHGKVYAPGLSELGLDPAALIIAQMPDDIALLRAATDGVRCAALGAVVIECRGHPRGLDLTASRRLALAARDSGVTAFMLRSDARPEPSAAETRWSIRAAASHALEAEAPGPPMFEMELLRRRGGPAGMRWRMEWNRDVRAFSDPAPGEIRPGHPAGPTIPGAVVPLSERGSAAILPPRLASGAV